MQGITLRLDQSNTAVLAAFMLVAIGVLGVWAAPWHGMSITTGKIALVELVLLGIGALVIRSWPVRLLCLWALAGTIMLYDWRSIVTCWRILLAGLAIEGLASHLTLRDLPKLLEGWRWITVLHTGYMLLQWTGIDLLFYATPGTPENTAAGFLGNTTIAGAYTAMTLPLFASKRLRWWIVPTLLATLATESLGAMFVAAAMLALVARMSWRMKWIPIVFAATLVIGAYSWRVESIPQKFRIEAAAGRTLVWQETMRQINETLQTWTIGHGPGQFKRDFRQESNKLPIYLLWKTAHNEPLQLWYSMGLVGLWLGLWVMGAWLLAALRSIDPHAQQVGLILFGWCLASMYTFVGHVSIACVAIVCGGVLEVARRQRVPGVVQ